MPSRSVVLAGATGLIGDLVLKDLLLDPGVAKVQVLARRPLATSHPKLQVHVVDFRKLPALEPVDEAYLALGTTIKIAGSQEAFRAVDLDANLAVANAALAAGAKRMALVSAVGADAKSAVFYNRVKGELEDALKALQLDALVIAQPSLLLGDRKALKQPPRFGEGFAAPLMTLISPLLPRRYRPVRGEAVAKALVRTLPAAKGLVVLSSDELIRLGADRRP
ncbi:NAD(P)H-binding protein [Variovorax sp. OV329]|uniref:NAD(P)H-binding protein n=1 Tax=Variovorax sp. OV329 TaxID=1882825 RepID=UPI000A8EE6AD|nr:NAD(P)H-binding protein [Variovorax sp. OV329]